MAKFDSTLLPENEKDRRVTLDLLDKINKLGESVDALDAVGVAAEGAKVPIGGIIPFHANIKTPALDIPYGYAPCNGAVVNDHESPLHGITLPDLNNSAYGSSGRGRYLRGGNTSGLLNGSTFRKYSGGASYGGSGSYYGAWVHIHYNLDGDPSGANSASTYSSTAAAVNLTNTPYQVTAMTVVWIMRIK